LQSIGAQLERVMIVGGEEKNPGVGPIASAILGRPFKIFPPREFVADGAARQAAWALLRELPNWQTPDTIEFTEIYAPFVLDQHRELKEKSPAIDAFNC
jgi:xylulokinase